MGMMCTRKGCLVERRALAMRVNSRARVRKKRSLRWKRTFALGRAILAFSVMRARFLALCFGVCKLACGRQVQTLSPCNYTRRLFPAAKQGLIRRDLRPNGRVLPSPICEECLLALPEVGAPLVSQLTQA